MFDFDPDEEEVDFAYDDVFEVISDISSAMVKLRTVTDAQVRLCSHLKSDMDIPPTFRRLIQCEIGLTLPCCTRIRCADNPQSQLPS